MVDKEVIDKSFVYVVKCRTISSMKEQLSRLSREEKTSLLEGRLTPLEWEEYNQRVEGYDSKKRYIQICKDKGREDMLPKILEMIEEDNQMIDDELFKYDRRIIEDYTVPDNPVPSVDESKYHGDEDILERNENDGILHESYLIGETEQSMINQQEESLDLTRNQVHCLGGYFTDDYKYIKARINHDKNYMEDLSYDEREYYEKEYPRLIRGIDRSISNSKGLQGDTIVYHAGLPDIGLVPGMHGVYKSYTSTSFQKQTCVRHRDSHYGDDGWITRILAPRGTKGVCGNDKRFHGYSFWDEHEYLLGRNTGYTVLSMDYNTHEMVVILDEP